MDHVKFEVGNLVMISISPPLRPHKGASAIRKARFPSSTLLPFFFWGSLIKTE